MRHTSGMRLIADVHGSLMKIFLFVPLALLLAACKGKEQGPHRQGDGPTGVPGPMAPGPQAPGPTGGAPSAGTATADPPGTSDPINTAPTTAPTAPKPEKTLPNRPATQE